MGADGKGKLAGRIAVVTGAAGGIGSKIAEMLVRSGVERLLLVDGDVFLPENLERHALDWRDVGARKVDVMKARLLEIAPAASIATVDQNPSTSCHHSSTSRFRAAAAAATTKRVPSTVRTDGALQKRIAAPVAHRPVR